jgi:hypothetical protein
MFSVYPLGPHVYQGTWPHVSVPNSYADSTVPSANFNFHAAQGLIGIRIGAGEGWVNHLIMIHALANFFQNRFSPENACGLF